MLKKLRNKFVTIIMILVGAVLIGVLGGTFLSTVQQQLNMTYEALDRGIEGSLRNVPRWDNVFGPNTDAPQPPDSDRFQNNEKRDLFVLIIDLDAQGIVVATNDAPMVLDGQTMSEVLTRAVESEKDMEWDTSLHIAWKRAKRDNDATRIVICDTYAQDTTIRTLFVRNAIITVVAMAILFAISCGLANLVMRPVEGAWQQQRQFVADASHELKTPLAVIIANCDILMREGKVSDESRRWVESTREESAHMRVLVEELLELARTDETQSGATGVMAADRIDLSSLVESAALEFDAIAYERGTSIEADIAPDIHVRGDREWLGRLTKILIDNACKYAQGPEPVTVRLSARGKSAELSVTNHGNTISEEDLPHVFDRFYRTDKARSRAEGQGGFGLGLAIAQGIANSHGGSIACVSTDESGTTFTVTLPTVA